MRAVAPLLIEKGYVIKVFDLIDTDRSDAFNPFPYLKDDKDAMKLVNNLIKNTTPKNSTNNDRFGRNPRSPWTPLSSCICSMKPRRRNKIWRWSCI